MKTYGCLLIIIIQKGTYILYVLFLTYPGPGEHEVFDLFFSFKVFFVVNTLVSRTHSFHQIFTKLIQKLHIDKNSEEFDNSHFSPMYSGVTSPEVSDFADLWQYSSPERHNGFLRDLHWIDLGDVDSDLFIWSHIKNPIWPPGGHLCFSHFHHLLQNHLIDLNCVFAKYNRRAVQNFYGALIQIQYGCLAAILDLKI